MRIIKENKIFKVLRTGISEPGIIKQKKKLMNSWKSYQEFLKKKLGLGFDTDYHPIKDWLIKVLHHLSPKNPIFEFEEESLFGEIPAR